MSQEKIFQRNKQTHLFYCIPAQYKAIDNFGWHFHATVIEGFRQRVACLCAFYLRGLLELTKRRDLMSQQSITVLGFLEPISCW